MSSVYNEQLTKLREKLPVGFQEMILKKDRKVTINQVKNAFSNRYVSEKAAKRIFEACLKIIDETEQKQLMIAKETEKVLTADEKAA